MKTTTVVALIAGAQSAVATYSWPNANPFSCPGNTPVNCDKQQHQGFDWSSLQTGSFSNYGGFQFSGFECKNTFDGKVKRDRLTGRTFQQKCITGTAGPDKSSAPSFSCGGSKEVSKFSVGEFHVTPEFDCDLQFHYTMPDKSICKHTSACSKSGTVVKNTQCGGATDVHVVYPSPPKGKPSKCSIGIHSVSFQCSATSTVVKATTKPAKPTTVPGTTKASTTAPATSPAETTPAASSTISSAAGTTSVVSSSVPAVSSTSAVETTPAASSTISSAAGTTSAVSSSIPAASSTSAAETTPAVSSSVESSVSSAVGTTVTTPVELITTVIVDITTSFCPVTETHVTAGSTTIVVGTTVSTVKVTRTHTTCTKCNGKPTATPSVSSAVPTLPSSVVEVPSSTPSAIVDSTTSAAGIESTTSAASPVESTTDVPEEEVPTTSTEAAPTSATSEAPLPSADCPEVLPQCLNTWMFSSECADNTDASCFCKSSEYVCNVFDCLSAHGSPEDIASATAYMQGICAPYIDVNTAIITCAAPPTVPAGNSSIPIVPTLPEAVTTIQILTTVTVPCSTSGTAIPGSSTASVISTALTVPQVVFQTQTAEGTSSAALVVGTPAPAPATVPAGVITPAAPAATTFATVQPSSGPATTASPTTPLFTGASSKVSMTFGSLLAAAFVAVFAL